LLWRPQMMMMMTKMKTRTYQWLKLKLEKLQNRKIQKKLKLKRRKTMTEMTKCSILATGRPKRIKRDPKRGGLEKCLRIRARTRRKMVPVTAVPPNWQKGEFTSILVRTK